MGASGADSAKVCFCKNRCGGKCWVLKEQKERKGEQSINLNQEILGNAIMVTNETNARETIRKKKKNHGIPLCFRRQTAFVTQARATTDRASAAAMGCKRSALKTSEQ